MAKKDNPLVKMTDQQVLDEFYLRLRRIALSDVITKYEKIHKLLGAEDSVNVTIPEIESFIGRIRPFLLDGDRVKVSYILKLVENTIPKEDSMLLNAVKASIKHIESFLNSYNISKQRVNNPSIKLTTFNDYDLLHILIYEDFLHMSPMKNQSHNFDAYIIYPNAFLKSLELVDELMFLLLVLEELRIQNCISISEYVFESVLRMNKMSSSSSGIAMFSHWNPIIKAYYGESKERGISFSFDLQKFVNVIEPNNDKIEEYENTEEDTNE